MKEARPQWPGFFMINPTGSLHDLWAQGLIHIFAATAFSGFLLFLRQFRD